jgi:hypothetical protein
MAAHACSQADKSVAKLRASALNASASTSVLRTNHNIINVRNASKEKPGQYKSMAKIAKIKSQSKEKGFHTKTISIVKDVSTIDRLQKFQDLKFLSSSKRDQSS